MIELRLCSLELARWLDAKASGSHGPPPSGKALGLMFGRAMADERAVAAVPVAGTGVKYESATFLISVAHALGAAAAACGLSSEEADQIERFVSGRVDVPASLVAAGVRGVMTKESAEKIALWIRSIDKGVFEEEVASMFGAASGAYMAATRDLQRFFTSVSTHGADVCVYGEI
jgi:hypothetical protein